MQYPRITTTLRVTPTASASYPVECTELCGAGHSLMRSAVHVVTPSAFRTWLQDQKAGRGTRRSAHRRRT